MNVLQNASERPLLTTRAGTPHHLTKSHVGIHAGRSGQKEIVNKTRSILRASSGSGDSIAYGVEKDGLRSAIDDGGTVEGANVRIDFAIADNVWTCGPRCHAGQNCKHCKAIYLLALGDMDLVGDGVHVLAAA